MKILSTKKFKTLFNFGVIISALVVLTQIISGYSLNLSKAHAYSTSCPEEIKDSPECLDYLEQQQKLIEKEKSIVNQNLSAEQYSQLSLLEKINYLDSKIASLQNKIDSLAVEIETKNVEIKILASEISVLENSISTISQEIGRLNNSIDKRISISYKYSFVGPLELLLETQNFDNLLRRIKYLTETRKKDKELLGDLSENSRVLEEEEKILSDKKVEVQIKRDKIEEEKSEQFELKEELSSQRSERSALYAESKKREQQLLAQAAANKKASDAVEAAVIKYIQTHPEALVDSGYVPAGTAIGQMGSTGCSTGAHLHFTIEKTTDPIGYARYSPWSGYLKKSGPFVVSGSMTVPLAGSAYLTQDHHRGWSGGMPYAIDMSTGISGTTVRAARSGTLYKGTEPICGGKYAKIVHSGGIQTLYLHLK
jgi:peptidoglycan hydrolase CwlO-like protein